MLDRFGPGGAPVGPTVDDPWVARLVQAFETYWRRALTTGGELREAEDALAAEVGDLVGQPHLTADALDDVDGEVRAEAERRGVHVLLGRTAPLRELMVWREERVEHRRVALPGGVEEVRVTFFDDFAVRGWGHYATCGRRSAGGWATEEGLFAVVPAYRSLTDETFSVRFLAHEAQHFADKRRLPDL